MIYLYAIYVISLFTIAIASLYKYKALFNSRLTYWSFAIPLVLYTAFRPLDISRDDEGYKYILENIDSYFQRDFAWYVLATFVEKIGGYRSVLVLTGFFLILKLYVLSFLEKNRIVALFLYVTIYWQLHDITQLRLSLGMLFVFAALVFYDRRRVIYRNVFFVFGSLFHLQIAVWFLGEIFFKYKSKISCREISLLFISTYLAVQIDLFGNVLHQLSLFFGPISAVFVHLFESYQSLSENLSYDVFKYPLIMIAGYIMFIISYCMDKAEVKKMGGNYIPGMIAFSMILVMISSSLIDVMVRFFELYVSCFIVYAGRYAGRKSSLLLMLFGILYFLKLNILWSVLSW